MTSLRQNICVGLHTRWGGSESRVGENDRKQKQMANEKEKHRPTVGFREARIRGRWGRGYLQNIAVKKNRPLKSPPKSPETPCYEFGAGVLPEATQTGQSGTVGGIAARAFKKGWETLESFVQGSQHRVQQAETLEKTAGQHTLAPGCGLCGGRGPRQEFSRRIRTRKCGATVAGMQTEGRGCGG